MKRVRSTASAQRDRAFSRQHGLSCRFCRSKKLKCDRLAPCSNCTSRQIPCVSAVEGIIWSQPSQATTLSESPANDTVGGSTTAEGENETSNLLQRLKQLEDAVFSRKTPMSSSAPIQQADHHDFRSETIERDHGIARQPPSEPENTGTDVNAYILVGTPSSSHRPPAVSELVDILPSFFDARALFAFYVENLNWYLPIIHVPTTWCEFEKLYKCLQDGTPPDWPQISLLVAILSVAVYFWQDGTTGNAPCPVKDPKACCRSWMILVQRALAEANHLICPLLETLQAKVLLTLFLPTYPQNTGRRGQVALLITEAQILQLDRVDSPRQRKTRENPPTLESMVRLEIQRRVWWVIVMSDWMYSFVNWGQPGTYLVHPDHMNVRFPSNVEDDNIRPGYNCNQPLSGPVTVMTFLIARLLIANIIQKLTDAMNKAELGDVELDYSTVMIFDKKINDTYNALPAYLHYETDPEALKNLFEERPYLDRQRKLLLFGLHNSLALLHRRYLARSYQDQRYIYSRITCLRSTRIVLEMQEAVRGSLLGRAWLVVFHVFIATTTLTMDYVYNRRDPRQAAERKAEILKCYRILEQCGQQDPEVKQGMESLKRTMQGWKSRTDTRPPNISAHRSTSGEVSTAEMENWSASRSSELFLQSQPQQQMIPQPPPDLPGAARLPWWSRDAVPALAMQHMAQQVASESLARPVEDHTDWPNCRNLPFDFPHMTTGNETDGLSMVPPEPTATTAQWMQPSSPDLWLPCLDPDGTGTADFPWEDMFRDFGVQQSRAGF
ncbi:uncharacterized protein PV07_11074 [Cladophialophora immunda]|uniref:Zn(2)-C6 fungal-type domain-containing protein n=1 Tax=Cladophialophora immunda TaxID=569365 RepID=A0A0D2BUS2_9EURO|nr:uncharacterized protein PV07_11074 [Cladophialophora immunda]KIW22813.1 hypothetical protein PV07_11074 [Cladophialophora immunda]OQU93948.1 Fungal Zn2-Cys6 binuclear cluster domain-containing protein [Cladophialophora immunda]